jgi:hypothetical protein
MKEFGLNTVKTEAIELHKNSWASPDVATPPRPLTPEEQEKQANEELFWSAK